MDATSMAKFARMPLAMATERPVAALKPVLARTHIAPDDRILGHGRHSHQKIGTASQLTNVCSHELVKLAVPKLPETVYMRATPMALQPRVQT